MVLVLAWLECTHGSGDALSIGHQASFAYQLKHRIVGDSNPHWPLRSYRVHGSIVDVVSIK
jgi:hypothetical protein